MVVCDCYKYLMSRYFFCNIGWLSKERQGSRKYLGQQITVSYRKKYNVLRKQYCNCLEITHKELLRIII